MFRQFHSLNLNNTKCTTAATDHDSQFSICLFSTKFCTAVLPFHQYWSMKACEPPQYFFGESSVKFHIWHWHSVALLRDPPRLHSRTPDSHRDHKGHHQTLSHPPQVVYHSTLCLASIIMSFIRPYIAIYPWQHCVSYCTFAGGYKTFCVLLLHYAKTQHDRCILSNTSFALHLKCYAA